MPHTHMYDIHILHLYIRIYICMIMYVCIHMHGSVWAYVCTQTCMLVCLLLCVDKIRAAWYLFIDRSLDLYRSISESIYMDLYRSIYESISIYMDLYRSIPIYTDLSLPSLLFVSSYLSHLSHQSHPSHPSHLSHLSIYLSIYLL